MSSDSAGPVAMRRIMVRMVSLASSLAVLLMVLQLDFRYRFPIVPA
jgi:hypothetical protein